MGTVHAQRQPGIVDQQVDLQRSITNLLDRRLDRHRVGHIQRQRNEVGAQFGFQRLQLVHAPGATDYAVAFADQGTADGATKARRGAGYECGFHQLSPCRSVRSGTSRPGW